MNKNTQHVKDWRKRVKIAIVDGFGGSCGICGYHKSLNCLEFHHVDPSQKEFSFGAIRASKGWDDLVLEIEKCVMLCSNCHKEVHDPECETFVPEDIQRFDINLTNWKPRRKEYDECICGVVKLKRRKFCSQICSSKSRQRVDWERIDLVDLVSKYSYEDIGKMFGISGKTVSKKHKKIFNAPID